MFLNKNKIISMYLYSNKAELSLSLGTILGNLGLNFSKFTVDFNFFTKNLPDYLCVKVNIVINVDRSIKFSVEKPSIGFLLNLLKIEKSIKPLKEGKVSDETFFCISLTNIIQICMFKFPDLNIQKSLPIVLGSAKSINLKVIYD